MKTLYDTDNILIQKKLLEKQIIETKKKLKELEEQYYQKYLKGNGD